MHLQTLFLLVLCIKSAKGAFELFSPIGKLFSALSATVLPEPATPQYPESSFDDLSDFDPPTPLIPTTDKHEDREHKEAEREDDKDDKPASFLMIDKMPVALPLRVDEPDSHIRRRDLHRCQRDQYQRAIESIISDYFVAPQLPLKKKYNFERHVHVDPSSGMVDTYTDQAVSKIFRTLTLETMEILEAMFELGLPVPYERVLFLIHHASIHFKSLKSLVYIDVPKSTCVTVCGDIHGQYRDLKTLFKTFGLPSREHMYLFNGDIVDRGPDSVQVVITLLCYKLLYPDSFFINRGNHEAEDICSIYGFRDELKDKYPTGMQAEILFKAFTDMFAWMPICHVIQRAIFVVHGGLPRRAHVKLSEIESMIRNRSPTDPSVGILNELCWADPDGTHANLRGASYRFTIDITKYFLRLNRLKLVIRSHEMVDGVRVDHEGLCLTVFSAPNYHGRHINRGAVIHVHHNTDIKVEYFHGFVEPLLIEQEV